MTTGLKANIDGSAAIQVGGTDVINLTSGGNATFTQAANLPNTFGFKNRIMNGNMAIAQRATSATVTAGTAVPTASTGYPAVDRFFVYSTGANVTAARVAGAGATQYRMQITGAASVTAVGVGQRIEQLNSYDFAGSTCSFSVDLANSLLTTVTWTASYANTADTFGTIGTPTKTQIATGTFTVNSTVTNYSVNISVPAAATTGIEILLTVGAQTSGTWTIGNMQFEKGSTATSFDYRPYGMELQLCQRYFELTSPIGTLTSSGTGYGNVVFLTSKRTTPTLTVRSGGIRWIRPAVFDVTSTSAIAVNTYSQNAYYFTQAVSGSSAGTVAIVSQDTLEVNAEL